MIELVKECMRTLGLLSVNEEISYNVLLSGLFTFEVYCKCGTFYIARIAQESIAKQNSSHMFVDLKNEYHLNMKAHSIYQPYTPCPLGYLEINGYHIIIFEGIRHSPFLNSELKCLNKHITSHFIDFFSLTVHDSTCDNASRIDLFKQISEMAAQMELTKVQELMRDDAYMKRVFNLPNVHQHGDFVINNIGLTKNSMVIFDWEDYRKVDLPGFDVFMLQLTSHDFDISSLENSYNHKKDWAINMILAKYLSLYHMDERFYFSLIPFYLLIFYKLKENYFFGIKNVINKLLKQYK